MAFLKGLSTAQRIGLVFAAIFYVVAGALHFVKTDADLRIMPPYVPWHLSMVRISGVFEILGGLGLLVSQMRRAAAWGLVALLIAVFPANLIWPPIQSRRARLQSRLYFGGGASPCNGINILA